MTAEQFVYWLNGFVELNGQIPTSSQWSDIVNHLKIVFHKVTPYTPPISISNERKPWNVGPFEYPTTIC